MFVIYFNNVYQAYLFKKTQKDRFNRGFY